MKTLIFTLFLIALVLKTSDGSQNYQQLDDMVDDMDEMFEFEDEGVLPEERERYKRPFLI